MVDDALYVRGYDGTTVVPGSGAAEGGSGRPPPGTKEVALAHAERPING